ncbi:acyl-CoA thioesterase [bacterium]|nr:acyl-CoA thioesterase [bacterium]
MALELSSKLRVRSSDLDPFGHANHAAFLEFYEHARLEYLMQKDLSFQKLMRMGYLFPVVHAEVDYLKPLMVMDEIEIVGRLEALGRTSITLIQEMYRLPGRELVSKAKFVAVFIDRETGQPVVVPAEFKAAFWTENQ